VLFGAQRPFVVALIVVAQAALERRLGGALGDVDPTAAAAAVRADLAATVHDLPGPLRPAGVVVTTRPFSVAGGQVTPNLKVRRAQVAADYAGPIDELYAAIGRAAGAPVSISRDEGNLWLLSV
jgi:long-chain acyl-CoA synthetase